MVAKRNWAEARGVTLLDSVVGTALMLVVFVGIAAAFQLSVSVVTNNKARAGAVALGNDRLEYIRSLPYTSVGTVGGTPSGAIQPTEAVVSNGITYTRRTVIVYEDDPKDDLGAQDDNQNTNDYKAVKVELSWNSRGNMRSLSFTTRVSPPSIEP